MFLKYLCHMTHDQVWTTGRVAEWLISIDLKEYANKLSYSGIHGAVIINDKDFTVDTLASALGIPVQRKVLRRHMEQELTSEALIVVNYYS